LGKSRGKAAIENGEELAGEHYGRVATQARIQVLDGNFILSRARRRQET
jgi:hypothetical protein